MHHFLQAQLPDVLSKLEGPEHLAEAVHTMLQAAPVSALPHLLKRRALDMQPDTLDGSCCGVTRCLPPEAAQQVDALTLKVRIAKRESIWC